MRTWANVGERGCPSGHTTETLLGQGASHWDWGKRGDRGGGSNSPWFSADPKVSKSWPTVCIRALLDCESATLQLYFLPPRARGRIAREMREGSVSTNSFLRGMKYGVGRKQTRRLAESHLQHRLGGMQPPHRTVSAVLVRVRFEVDAPDHAAAIVSQLIAHLACPRRLSRRAAYEVLQGSAMATLASSMGIWSRCGG